MRASAWLFLDRCLRLGLGFLTGVMIARHYGPSTYGELTYVVVTAALLGSFASLGLDEISPRDFAAQDRGITPADMVATKIRLRFFAGVIAYGLLMGSLYLTKGTGVVFWLASLYGLYLPLQATDILEYRARAEGAFFAIAKRRSGASALSALAKLSAVVANLSIIAISLAMLLEYWVASLLFLLGAHRKSRQTPGRFHAGYARELLGRSRFVILSGTLALLQNRIDSLMIEHFLGWERLGQYSAGLKVMELFDTVPIVLSLVLVPEFARQRGPMLASFARRAYLIGGVLYLLALPLMGLVWQLFPWLYGSDYLDAQAVMPYLFIKPLLVLMGFLRAGLAVAEGNSHYLPWYALTGCLLSAVLGWLIIPTYGLPGAAMASMISLTLSNLGVDSLLYRRHLGWMLSCPRELPTLFRQLHR